MRVGTLAEAPADRRDDPVAVAARLIDDGCYEDAVRVLRDDAERLSSSGDWYEVALAHVRLGVACKFAGLLDEAERSYSIALPVALAHADVDPEFLAGVLHNLGGLAHARKQNDLAEAYARRGLSIRLTRCPEAEAVAADRAALAAILESAEAWTEAQALYRLAVATWTELGEDHELAMALNGLAGTLRFTGRCRDAELVFRRALGLLEQTRGPDHPDTATVQNNLAMLLAATGRAAEACGILQRACRSLERSLGSAHPATVDVRSNLDRICT